MKRFITIITIALSVLASLASCTKDSANAVPVVKTYTNIVLDGDNPLIIPLKSTFVEPGYTATDKEEDATSKVQVKYYDLNDELVSKIETENPGLYTIVYSATSNDNVTIQTSRTVYVIDPDLKISLKGSFAVDFEKSTCESAPAAAEAQDFKTLVGYYAANGTYGAFATDKFDLTFQEIAPGIYKVNDILGGWYNAVQGRGGYYADAYGSSYQTYFDMTATLFLYADGSIALASSFIKAWEDGADYLKDGKYDAENGTLYWETQYAGSVGPIHVYANRK